MSTLLKGYRTYILAGTALVVIAGNLLGIVSVDVANTLLSLLGFGSLITLRAAV